MNERPEPTKNRGRYVRVNRMTARQRVIQELQSDGAVARASSEEAA